MRFRLAAGTLAGAMIFGLATLIVPTTSTALDPGPVPTVIDDSVQGTFDLAADSDGRIALAYIDNPSGLVMLTTRPAGSSTWTVPTPISAEPAAEVAVNLHSGQGITVGWIRIIDGSLIQAQVEARSSDAQGNWAPVRVVAPIAAATGHAAVRVLVDSAGRSTIGYLHDADEDPLTLGYNLSTQALGSSDGTWGAPELVGEANYYFNYAWDFALTPNDDLVAVSGYQQVATYTRSATGSAWTQGLDFGPAWDTTESARIFVAPSGATRVIAEGSDNDEDPYLMVGLAGSGAPAISGKGSSSAATMGPDGTVYARIALRNDQQVYESSLLRLGTSPALTGSVPFSGDSIYGSAVFENGRPVFFGPSSSSVSGAVGLAVSTASSADSSLVWDPPVDYGDPARTLYGVKGVTVPGNELILATVEDTLALVVWTGDAPVPPPFMTSTVKPVTVSKTLPVNWSQLPNGSTASSFDLSTRSAPFNGGFGTPTLKAGLTGTSAALVVQPGRTYCVSVRGIDSFGRVGEWSAESCSAIPIDDRLLTASAGWTAGKGKPYFLGTYREARAKGSTLSVRGVKGVALSLVASKGPGMGKVTVFLGAQKLGTYALAASSSKHRVVIPIHTFASLRTGTVKIVVATAGKPVRIDGLVIRR